jgi:hypothetical protein
VDDRVFVDTCIWSPFFAKPASAEKVAVDALIDSDRVALIGPVMAEILLGFRRKDQADWAASRLRMAHLVDTNWDDWQAAATLGRELASKGHKLPLTDLVLAVIAMRVGAWLYTTDPHFDLIPEIRRYRPE